MSRSPDVWVMGVSGVVIRSYLYVDYCVKYGISKIKVKYYCKIKVNCYICLCHQKTTMKQGSILTRGIQFLTMHGFTNQVKPVKVSTLGMEEQNYEGVTIYSDKGRVYYHVHEVGIFQDTRFTGK